jgi:hypothetical protein
VKRLLVRATSRRLGCMAGGVAEVKQHPWFRGFDWDALAQRRLKAPYVPKVGGWGRGAGAGAAGIQLFLVHLRVTTKPHPAAREKARFRAF